MTEAPDDVVVALTKAFIAFDRKHKPMEVAQMLCRLTALFVHSHATPEARARVLAGMMSDITDMIVRIEEEVSREPDEEVKH